MKALYTNGVGNQQTLTNAQDEKIVIYDTIEDAQLDLNNLKEGQIIGTKEPISPSNIANVIQEGNMNAVTSNAVAVALLRLPIAPSNNGTYNLQCVVLNGTPSYNWVAVN